MTERETLCAVTPDGRHKLKPWAGDGRSGFACEACHRTWTHDQNRGLVPTYPRQALKDTQHDKG